MSRKRLREDTGETPLKDLNAKRPHYDLRTNHIRQCCSLPQYDKRPCQHKYHLRPFEHRQPANYIGMKQAFCSSAYQDGRRKADVCPKFSTESDLKRNAHSYSVNGHIARSSNSSTASGRLRTLQALKKSAAAAVGRKKNNDISKEVNVSPNFILSFFVFFLNKYDDI